MKTVTVKMVSEFKERIGAEAVRVQETAKGLECWALIAGRWENRTAEFMSQ
jgi:hypothetical protein